MNDALLSYFGKDELAANVWFNKYALKDNDGNVVEQTPDDMHRRLAKKFYEAEMLNMNREAANMQWKDGVQPLSNYGNERKPLTEEDIYNLFKGFKYIIPQGSIMQMLGNEAKIGSLSNCFVIGQPVDSYGGIMLKDQEQVQLMKRRGGVGMDLSSLRPRHTKVNNAALTSSGGASFAHRYSNSTREVAQDGRRGALMLTLNVRHPDIFEFVDLKLDLTKVTGANLSVMIHDDFMDNVKNDGDYILRYPVDAKINISTDDMIHDALYQGENGMLAIKIKARKLWDRIISAAHKSAEPGVMFIDNHWNYSPDGVYPRFKGISTNPCGEIFMGEYDACRLIAINLLSFVEFPYTKRAFFNFDKFYEVVYEQQRLADDLVDLEIEAINKIIEHIDRSKESIEIKAVERNLWLRIKETAKAGRRTGSGFTALGDVFAAMNIEYGSEKGQELLEHIMRTKFTAELDCTIDLAVLRGHFEGYDASLEFEAEAHENDVHQPTYTITKGTNPFYQMLLNEFPEQAYRMYNHGRRNISWSTLAPTGSVSILTQTTSGIEPVFQVAFKRRKKINANDSNVRVDFVDDLGDKFQEFNVIHPQLQKWYDINNPESNVDLTKVPFDLLQKLVEESPWYGSTSDVINVENRIKTQAIVQKYTTHSISSTINLSKDATVETIGKIYMMAKEHNLKGVTVYRDGSRSGIMVTNTQDAPKKFVVQHAVKRPSVLNSKLHFATVKGNNHVVVIGLLENKPYEIFSFTDEKRMNKVISGKTIKVKKGVYMFKSDDGEFIVENLVHESDVEEQASTLYVSQLLRHGTPITHVIKTMKKVSTNVSSFTAAVTRVLSLYVPNGTQSAETCHVCGSKLTYENGCSICKNCGQGGSC